MKKKKLVEVHISVKLDRRPTPEELESLKKIFPGKTLIIHENWERETKV